MSRGLGATLPSVVSSPHSHPPVLKLERPDAPSHREQANNDEDNTNNRLQEGRHEQHEYTQNKYQYAEQHVPVHDSPPSRTQAGGRPGHQSSPQDSPHSERTLLKI